MIQNENLQNNNKEDEKEELKELLLQYSKSKRRKKLLENRRMEIISEFSSPLNGKGYSMLPNSTTNKVGLGSASIVMRLAEIEERINIERDIAAKEMIRVMDILDFLPRESTERAILELKYIDCKNWDYIQKAMHLSKSPCFDYLNKGIELLLQYKKVHVLISEYNAYKKIS